MIFLLTSPFSYGTYVVIEHACGVFGGDRRPTHRTHTFLSLPQAQAVLTERVRTHQRLSLQ